MSTINDLSVISSVSSADKLPVWSNANGVTRGLPISVLDGRYITQDQINLLQISPTPEIFSAGDGIVPNTFVPGTTFSLVLANLYGSGDNIDVFFDGTFQGSDQWSLTAYSLIFTSPIPVGVSKVYVKGGAARITNGVSPGSITDASVASSSALFNRVNDWIDVKDPAFGAKGDGTTDDTAAINLADIAATARGVVLFFPGGTYIANKSGILRNGASWFGSGKFKSVIKAKAETYTVNLTGMVSGSNLTGAHTRDLGFDMSLATFTAGSGNPGNIYWALSFAASTHWSVNNCSFTGIQTQMIAMLANGGSDFEIADSYFNMPVPNSNYNQAINVVSSPPSNPASTYRITGNTMAGTALDSNGSYGFISKNYITGWKFGSGLTFGPFSTATNNVITDNIILNGAGFDQNSTYPNGIECWSPYSVIKGNICAFNSGTGIAIGSQNITVAQNICYGNGQTVGSGGSGISSVGIGTGFNAINCMIIGNQCFDPQATKTQQYGYSEAVVGGSVSFNTVDGNDFNNNALGTTNLVGTLGAFRGPQLVLTTVANPGPIANGTQVAANYSMAGVTYGDTVKVSYAGDPSGVNIFAYVNAPGSVVVTFTNNSGATQNLPSRAVNIWVEKPAGYASIS